MIDKDSESIKYPDMTVSITAIKSRLIVNDFSYTSYLNRPNWWWRFWQWLLLGWRWEKVE